MTVWSFEPVIRERAGALYSYNFGRDLLQINNEIVYKLDNTPMSTTPAYLQFLDDMSDLETGHSNNVETMSRVNEYLGKIGMPDEIKAEDKEILWVL